MQNHLPSQSPLSCHDDSENDTSNSSEDEENDEYEGCETDSKAVLLLDGAIQSDEDVLALVHISVASLFRVRCSMSTVKYREARSIDIGLEWEVCRVEQLVVGGVMTVCCVYALPRRVQGRAAVHSYGVAVHRVRLCGWSVDDGGE